MNFISKRPSSQRSKDKLTKLCGKLKHHKMRICILIILLLALNSCGAFQQNYNRSYSDMPPPLSLYFDNGVRHLSFSAKLALLERVDYLNDNPKLQAEIVGYDNTSSAIQVAHIVEKEFLDQGIPPRRLRIIETAIDTGANTPPHVAIRLVGSHEH